MNNDNTKLATTALVASGLGAALSYLMFQRQQKSRPRSNSMTFHIPSDAPKSIGNSRTSFIFQDPEYDMSSGDRQSSVSDTTILMPHSHEERMRRRIAARMAVEDENSQPRQSVTVRVPASSANCGPGYDCIGLAVDLWTEVTVSRADEFEITAEGDGAEEMPKDDSNYIVTGVKA
eukprot:scaffold4285_cov108-Skeletonema_marinoi.AAC.2